jgi:glycine dehydrogenase subunit 2
LFDKNILEITNIIHDCGGINYYDGANLNAVMGIARPGDMGFDVIHVNLHKTFSAPHGGGGPGSGPVGCKEFLSEYLPSVRSEEKDGKFCFIKAENSIGEMKSFFGNFLVVVRALAYLMTLGKEGVLQASENAVINANYMLYKLKDLYTPAYDRTCMHEFVLSVEKLKKETGVSALDIAKAMIDKGIHPPTMYFPLIVHEALMFEPTETESKETMDNMVQILRNLYEEAYTSPEILRKAPITTPVARLDEVEAARNPILRYCWAKDLEDI